MKIIESTKIKERRIQDLTKVVIEIKDKKDNDKESTVTIKMQGIDKASDTEKSTTSMIYNTVCESIRNLQ